MKTKKLNPAIIELAAKYDRLANEANFDESKHPRDDDGKFTSGGGGGGSGRSGERNPPGGGNRQGKAEHLEDAEMISRMVHDLRYGDKAYQLDRINEWLKGERETLRNKYPFPRGARQSRRETHKVAIQLGLTYNRSTHQYE